MTTTLTRAEYVEKAAGVCAHEAGHAVAAVLLGGEVELARVFEPGIVAPPAGNNVAPGHPWGATTYRSLPRFAGPSITYAGIWAEARWRTGGPPSPAVLRKAWTENATDRAELFSVHRDPADIAHTLIEPMLQRCWQPIIVVAQALSRTDLGVDDAFVRGALGLSRDPDVAGFQLAMIRSGSTPPVMASTGLAASSRVVSGRGRALR
jgi:hypothetical protein